MARSGASTHSQWGKNRDGSRTLEGVIIEHPDFAGAVTFADQVPTEVAVVIDHPDFAGFVTYADTGEPTAYMIDDPNFSGFVTPQSIATEADVFLYDYGDLGGADGFVTPNDAAFSVAAYLVDHPNHAGAVTPDSSGTAETADATPMIVGGSDNVIIVGI